MLRTKLSRVPSDRPELLDGPGHAFSKIDLGIFEGKGSLTDARGRIALLAGDPLLTARDGAATRNDDLVSLSGAVFAGSVAALAATRGSFSLVCFDPAARTIRLATDKLGLRPLYYTVKDGLLIFSSVLRQLAGLPGITDGIDLTGVAQKAALGFPLGARTPYARVQVLEPGHWLEATPEGVRVQPYFSWDTIEEKPSHPEDFSRRLHAAFDEAVKWRLGKQSGTVSFLSGGLDSRCVVASLRSLGAATSTINFAGEGSADGVLGRLAAEALGTRHFELRDGPYDFWERMVVAHAHWMAERAPAAQVPQPAQVWTGFAGETVIAPTNITAPMLAAMREGRIDDAIAAHFQRTGSTLLPRPFNRGVYPELRRRLHESFRVALAQRTCADPARRFHLHQLLNEARGNLAAHHDNLDVRRIEFIMPFFDAQVVTLALSHPLDEYLCHRFYHRWLAEFPPAATSVPWQTYPWSVACPLPLPPGLRLQWQDGWHSPEDQKAEDDQVLARAAQELGHPDFPDWLLSRWTLRLALWLARLGVRRHMYMFGVADRMLRAVLLARDAAAPAVNHKYTRPLSRKPEVVY